MDLNFSISFRLKKFYIAAELNFMQMREIKFIFDGPYRNKISLQRKKLEKQQSCMRKN